jgi:PPOX class probable F420-dependent enzyme
MSVDDPLALLSQNVFGHVATTNPDGQPQSTPVWLTTDGDHVLFSTVKGRQKHTNIANDPRVAISWLDPDDPYHYVEVRGTATLEDDPEGALIDELAKKYMDQDEYGMDGPDDERVIVRVAVEHTTGMGG